MKTKKEIEKKEVTLSDKEEAFCNLYVYGDIDFAGQHRKCYEEVFGQTKNPTVTSRRLLEKPPIMARIKELYKLLQNETETLAVKLQVTETLKAVMEETSSAAYTDRFGVTLSPAPLRAVSVNAAKALMELYPIKHVQEAKLRIEGEGGVIFNVIVPENKPVDHEET